MRISPTRLDATPTDGTMEGSIFWPNLHVGAMKDAART